MTFNLVTTYDLATIVPKLLENSKSALVCCHVEWRGWVILIQIVKVAHQTLLSSIRVKWEFSSNCGLYMGQGQMRLNIEILPYFFLTFTL